MFTRGIHDLSVIRGFHFKTCIHSVFIIVRFVNRVVFPVCHVLFADANQDDVIQEIASWCSSSGKRETPKVLWSIRAFDWFFGQTPSSLDCVQ